MVWPSWLLEMPTSCASFARSLIRRWICSSPLSMRARTASSFAACGTPARAPAARGGPPRREVLLAAMAAVSDEPCREDAFDAAELRQHLLADGAIDIDERVGVLAPRLVEKIGDVDFGAGETGRD